MRNLLLTIAGILLLLSSSLYASPLEVSKNTDDLSVKLRMDNDTAKTGESLMRISLADLNGNPVTDAKIKISYSMPPMKNMPPMSYKSRAKRDGEEYSSKVNFSMPGTWKIDIKIKRPGKDLTKTQFEINVE